MDFISNQKPQIQEMLRAIGVSDVEELFTSVPRALKHPPIKDDDGLSEFEGMQLMEELAAKNTFPELDNYLGGGAYQHHIPALISAVTSKSEFLTAYTPYQAEASQGLLQIIFEFQSAICALTGMDVSNASLYDGSSACAEAMLMALRCQKDRNKVLVSQSLHPHYFDVVRQYLSCHHTEIVMIPFTNDGKIDFEAFSKLIDDRTAAVLIQSPNFLGLMEEVAPVAAKAKSCGALTVMCANPLSYALFSSAGELGADIACGDAQPFGLPMSFGGPYIGYLACRQELVRQMPGRIVGETVDSKQRRGFVLTLQAREQHIRREKATSNICTNQALAALASLIFVLWYGKQGLKKLALTNFQRASYLRSQLSKIRGIELLSQGQIFNEFAVKLHGDEGKVEKFFRQEGIAPGISLKRYFPQLTDYFLVAVTEVKDKRQLDHYVETARKVS